MLISKLLLVFRKNQQSLPSG